MRSVLTGAFPEFPNQRTHSNLGARALSVLKERLRGRGGSSAESMLTSLVSHYGINPRTGKGMGAAFGTAPGADQMGVSATHEFLSGLNWTSQDFGTKQKEFQYGSVILGDRIAAKQAEVQKYRDMAAGKVAIPENFQMPDDAWFAQQESDLGLLQRQQEASQGFAGLMDLAGQVYEGKAGAFTELTGSLQKAIQLKQNLGGTYFSQAGAAQAASAQVGLTEQVKADLVPGLLESGQAGREFGYSFNLAGVADPRKWENYFEARLQAQAQGTKGGSEVREISAAEVDRIDEQGRPVLKRTSDAEQQKFLFDPNVSYVWKGSGKDRKLVATKNQASGTTGFSITPEEAAQQQKFAFNAPARHKYDEALISSWRAQDELRAAKNQGYRPTSGETIDEFRARTDKERTTMVRR